MAAIFNFIHTKSTPRSNTLVNQLFFSNVFHKLITGNQMAAIFNFIYIKLLLSSCTKLHSIGNIIMVHFDTNKMVAIFNLCKLGFCIIIQVISQYFKFSSSIVF